jgi:hypothetical protein
MNVKFISQAMDIMTTLLLLAPFILATLILFTRTTKRARLIRLVDKLPGPFSFPFLGSELPVMLAPRKSKSSHYFSTFLPTNGITRTGAVNCFTRQSQKLTLHFLGRFTKFVAFQTESCPFP